MTNKPPDNVGTNTPSMKGTLVIHAGPEAGDHNTNKITDTLRVCPLDNSRAVYWRGAWRWASEEVILMLALADCEETLTVEVDQRNFVMTVGQLLDIFDGKIVE